VNNACLVLVKGSIFASSNQNNTMNNTITNQDASIAAQILNQLGGNKFIVMTGATV